MRKISTQRETFARHIEAISQDDLENYRHERHRQEVELEGQTGGYSADKADYFARGGKPLLTLKDYMKGLKVGPGEQAARQAPVSHETYTPDPHAWGDPNEGPAW